MQAREPRWAWCLCAMALLAMACNDSEPAAPGAPPETRREPDVLVLPAPTGPLPVGKLTVTLVDTSRGGLFPGESASQRELVVHVWYPSEPAPDASRARYISPQFIQLFGVPPEDVERIQPHAMVEAPLSPAQASWPVVLFSHGYTAASELYTTLHEELASHGFVVVGIDHTFLASLTVFPDGRAIPLAPLDNPSQEVFRRYEQIMAEDASFVLSQLERWNQAAPPGRFSGRLDLSRTGHFGHSLGGGASIRLLAIDPRVQVGADMDGSVKNPLQAPLARPVLLLLAEDADTELPELDTLFHTQLAGPAYKLVVAGAQHNDFSDLGLLVDALALPLPPEVLNELGPIDSARAVAMTRAYLVALFNLHLRGQPAPLLEGPSPSYPEVRFERR